LCAVAFGFIFHQVCHNFLISELKDTGLN
jgi:hypothetical protein